MKLDEFIEELKKYQQKYGNIDVVTIYNRNWLNYCDVNIEFQTGIEMKSGEFLDAALTIS